MIVLPLLPWGPGLGLTLAPLGDEPPRCRVRDRVEDANPWPLALVPWVAWIGAVGGPQVGAGGGS